MKDVIVTINDVRRGGMCVRGARPWFEMHGLDFRDFLVNGISSTKVEHLGDPLADRAIKSAREAAATVAATVAERKG